MIMAAPGSRSDGFKIIVFPVAAAKGMVHKGIMLRDNLVGNNTHPKGLTQGN